MWGARPLWGWAGAGQWMHGAEMSPAERREGKAGEEWRWEGEQINTATQ